MSKKTDSTEIEDGYLAIAKSIPTLYRGVLFRSRLEARWAAFFDLVGWPWEYEPLDLNGYIPDFILKFYKPMLCEVKPDLELKSLSKHQKKIEKSGWPHEALLVGACIWDKGEASYDEPVIGWNAERFKFSDDEKKLGLLDEWGWQTAVLHKCRECGKFSFYNDVLTFTCRVNGCYEGDHFLENIGYEFGRRLFAEAGNAVQWNP